MKPAVYLCGPIHGLTHDEARYGWRFEIRKYLNKSIDVLSPMRQEGHLKEIGVIKSEPDLYDASPISRAKAIVAKDCLDIDRSDLLVVNMQGAKIPSIGSIFEMGYAYKAGKRIVLIMGDEDKVHNHVFVKEPAAITVPSVAEAAEIVNMLLTPGL